MSIQKQTVIVALLSVAAATASAEGRAPAPASRSETVGVASGLAIGAAAAGPIGAVLGAAAGSFFGDRLHRERSGRLDAERSVEASLGMLNAVMFRTDDCAIGEADVESLRQLGEWLATTPRAVARVQGYADARGASEHNLALSGKRAIAVAQVLEANGVPADRLIVEAMGERGTVLDQDGNALQRRVTVTIERRETARRVARTP